MLVAPLPHAVGLLPNAHLAAAPAPRTSRVGHAPSTRTSRRPFPSDKTAPTHIPRQIVSCSLFHLSHTAVRPPANRPPQHPPTCQTIPAPHPSAAKEPNS